MARTLTFEQYLKEAVVAVSEAKPVDVEKFLRDLMKQCQRQGIEMALKVASVPQSIIDTVDPDRIWDAWSKLEVEVPDDG